LSALDRTQNSAFESYTTLPEFRLDGADRALYESSHTTWRGSKRSHARRPFALAEQGGNDGTKDSGCGLRTNAGGDETENVVM
jgi:hypothetical protein